MRVLIINASPRKGNIASLMETVTSSARSADADVEIIDLYSRNIRPCIGCMACRSRLECHIDDDIANIAELLRRADRIVIGAPCYWGNMPGQLKNMFDRLVWLFIAHQPGHLLPAKLLRSKKALIITTSTTPMPWARLFGQTSGTVKSISRILSAGGIKCLRSLQIGNTANNQLPAKAHRKAALKLTKLLK